MERHRRGEDYARRNNASIDNNPSWGNKQGGLTTIIEKSLGAVAKGGTAPLLDVYQFAEPITSRGFTFMDTPGYDPISVTGLVAGGCQIVVFTTGRGSCFGCKPAPTIKVSTNTQLFNRMQDDMDINAGSIIDGESVESAGTRLFEKIISVASGEQTLSEQQGIGDEEFCPWMPGPIFLRIPSASLDFGLHCMYPPHPRPNPQLFHLPQQPPHTRNRQPPPMGRNLPHPQHNTNTRP